MTQVKSTKKAKKAKTSKTNIIFIIDESRSMMSTASDVRGGFNGYVKKLRGDGNEYSLTAIKFGSKVRPLFANLALNDVPLLTEANYMPLDSTALYDAIGHGMATAKDQWGTVDQPYGKDRVVFIIMTDGFENASREYSKDMVVSEIKKREEAGNWTFVYLGADQDAWSIASHLGFAQGNVMSYASSASAETFAVAAAATSTTSASSAKSTRRFFKP